MGLLDMPFNSLKQGGKLCLLRSAALELEICAEGRRRCLSCVEGSWLGQVLLGESSRGLVSLSEIEFGWKLFLPLRRAALPRTRPATCYSQGPKPTAEEKTTMIHADEKSRIGSREREENATQRRV